MGSRLFQIPTNDYNSFFHPNLCHICKWRNQSHLTPCVGCNMIFYCSEMHRMEHRVHHEEICEAIRFLSSTRNLWLTRGMTEDEWIGHKKRTLNDIQQIIGRELKKYEIQMFLFRKSCAVCHQQQTLQLGCSECFYINKCDDHKLINITHKCPELKDSLYLDIYEFMEYSERIPLDYLPKTIDDIVGSGSTEAITERFKRRGKQNTAWKFSDYIFSESISGPLTLCSFMSSNIKQERQNFVIHIMSGSLTDTQSLSAWEIVLHVLAPGTHLKIVMTKSELKSDNREEWDTCEDCRSLNKTLGFEIYDILYEYYVRFSVYNSPDVIVGFDTELEGLETSTILALQRQNCPLLLTSSMADTAMKNMEKLDKDTHMLLIPFVGITNKFRSHRPYRSILRDTCYSNYYTIFYNKLW